MCGCKKKVTKSNAVVQKSTPNITKITPPIVKKNLTREELILRLKKGLSNFKIQKTLNLIA
jgi:hypothetical protein